jgi:hypothetical protein
MINGIFILSSTKGVDTDDAQISISDAEKKDTNFSDSDVKPLILGGEGFC